MAPKSSADVAFEPDRLRLIVGSLALIFPWVVYVLAHGVTPSISASYYNKDAGDVFVGFLFIIGALFICYKGHMQGEAWNKDEDDLWEWIRSGRWLKIYQEDILSTFGGIAAILTALYPTACKECPDAPFAAIHTSGAFFMFAAVAYFCMIAFVRSLNKKLLRSTALKKDADVRRKILQKKRTIRQIRSGKVDGREVRGVQRWVLRPLYRLFPDFFLFLSIAKDVSRDYDARRPNGLTLADGSTPRNKVDYLWKVYDKMISRGIAYVVSGPAILITLASYIVMIVFFSTWVEDTAVTFYVEAISLSFFGLAWMTASKLEFIQQARKWKEAWKQSILRARQRRAKPATA